jgi:translocation and assembly module TamA
MDDEDICCARCVEWDCVQLEELGLELDEPALPAQILEAEDALLEWMNSQGYPLAQIVRHEIVADQSEYTIAVKIFVTTGPLTYLAFPTISGNQRVCREYIARKVDWCAGDLYCPECIACTFNTLEASGLFRCINIELGTETNEEGLLPVDIVVSEGKQRSIAAGGVYSSEWGGGFIAEWAHRNMRGMGEQLTLKTEVMQKYQTALISYRTPDFLCKGLDWLNTFEGEREITDSYHETSWTATSQLYSQLTPRLHVWAGAAVKYLFSSDTDNNRPFTLLKLPAQLRYSSADNLLDPHYGTSINIKVTPTTGIVPSSLTYCTARYDGAVYVPISGLPCLTLAGKLAVGTIVGASRFDIPPPERFYAGSPNTLRGYRYLTVSPLDAENKPEGGRSLFVISLEARHRLTEDWGLVGFWDWGNVYSRCLPQLDEKQLRSVGLGLRYYTAVGPLRFDFAFPLDRRPGIDGPYQFYFSIGQTY